MKTLFFLLVLVVVSLSYAQAQKQNAVNFTRSDCNGVQHDLFSELDSGNCVILEYFMTCSSCINAAQKIETMMAHYSKQLPGKLRFYMLGYTNSYSCTTAKGFVTSNGFNATPFDSGASQVAYYGGFGMPTIVVVGGKDHRVLFTGIGFTASDTTDMSAAIRELYGLSDVSESDDAALSLSPQPVSEQLLIRCDNAELLANSLQIFDIQGQRVDVTPGSITLQTASTLNVNVSAFTNGLYIARLRVNDRELTRRFVVHR